jgi:Rad3-related DNA helicase
MDETLNEQLTNAAVRLATAAEALETVLARIDAQHQELNAKVERIVAAIDESIAVRHEPEEPGDPAEAAELKDRVAELERANTDLKAQAARIGRKTLSPLVTAILAKNEVRDGADSAVLDKALASLSVEQRMAVKAEMARAGMIE